MPTRDMTLIGDRKLARKFRKLTTTASRNRVVRRPLTAALSPINKSAKQNAPVLSGALKKSIGTKVKSYPGGVWGGVGPRVGEKFTKVDEQGRKIVPANYAHLVEFGTARTPAKPFLRPALDSNRAIANRILKTGIWQNIKKEIAKT